MRTQTKRIVTGIAIVIVPVSAYIGSVMKERELADEFAKVPEDRELVTQRHLRAQIAALEQDRKELVAEKKTVDTKMVEIRERIEEANRRRGHTGE